MKYMDIDCYERGCACASSNQVAGENSEVVEVVKYSELSDEEIEEHLAELEHEQWMSWAENLKDTEALSIQRLNRWIDCFKPYSELSEEMKEHDRVWARKVLSILKKANEK